MKRWWLIATLSMALSPLAVWAHTAHGINSEHIQSFDSAIAITKNSTAQITETIEYDFANLDRHGIYRVIPTRTSVGDSSQYYYYDFNFSGAELDGQSVEATLSHDKNYATIRLGDPNITISGVHTYTIRYSLSPTVLPDPDGDFLNWNITGNSWNVPIEAVNATVEFPEGAEARSSRCYSGASGSTQQDCTVTASGNRVDVTASSLAIGSGVTVNVLVPSGSFTTYQELRDPPAGEWLPLLGFMVGLLAAFVGLAVRFLSWLRYRTKLSQQIVVAEYGPPDGLSPGEIGLLNDNRSNMQEITATLIDLAVRGFIKIEQTQAKSLFKKAQYRFHLLKDYQGTRPYETKLLGMLFSSNKKTVELKDVSSSAAATAISGVHKQFREELKTKGYYTKGGSQSQTRRVLWILIGLVILTVFGVNFYAGFNGASAGFAVVSCIAAIVGVVVGWFLSKRTELTAAGYGQWAKVEGLELFLTVTEKERLKFHDAPKKNPKLFNKLLPYAIALGVEKEWAKQFEGMDISKDTSWYVGSHAYTPIFIASSLASDFSPAISSNFTPVQSSSSSGGGFSGGGFSGGGGGGGGGGSW